MVGITRIFRLGIRLAAWATPHIQSWHRQRHMNRREGQRHLEAGNWTEAEKHLSAALSERKHPVPQQIELLLGLSTARCNRGNLADAEEAASQAIELAVRARNHDLHSLALGALADAQIAAENYEEAEKTIAEMTRLEHAQSQPDQKRLARCAHKLGSAMLKSGRSAEAITAFEKAAKLSEEIFGPNHIETANSLAELGSLCREKGDHAEAQRTLRRALEIHRALSGPTSAEATHDLYQLAASLEESGRLRDAMAEYERVLSWKERQVGGDPGETVDVQLRLAALYLKVDHFARARELLLHVAGILDRSHNPKLKQALEALAATEDQSGRPEEAERWREKAHKV